MPDLCVIIPVAQEDLQIARCIERIGAVFRDQEIRGRILVVSSPNLEMTNRQLMEIKTGDAHLDTLVNPDHQCPLVYDTAKNSNARVFLFLSNPDNGRVSEIPAMYRRVRDQYDIVIGSRYLDRDQVTGTVPRTALRGRVHTNATVLLSRILFPYISDPLSDFFAVRNEVISGFPDCPHHGAFLLEILGKSRWKCMCEIPVPSPGEITSCPRYKTAAVLFQVAGIGWYSFLHHESPAWKEEEKILRFIIVGFSGIFVNMGVLYVLTSVIGIFYLISSLVAIELSILNNFFWNDRWTFSGDDSHRLTDPWQRLGLYHLVSAGGIVINLGLLFVLTDFFGVYYLISNMIGILAAFSWNFLLNRNITWKPVWGGER